MTYLLIVVVVIGLVFLSVRKFSPNLMKREGNVEYILKDDPNAQGKYDSIKNPQHKTLSAKELLELSWAFLYDLTEVVLNKFSSTDQNKVMECGRTMVKNGMKYQHIIEDDPALIESYVKKIEEQKKVGYQEQVQR
jgi:hypothetical protein